MFKKIVALLLPLLFAVASGRSQRVVPLKPFPGDQRFEAVSGDVKKAGGVYVIRIHSEAGYIVMPHFHPEDEHIVVVKGRWALGMGERFRAEGLETMDVGTYGLVGAKMAHFARSRTDAILQVHGIGPFTTTWVTPMYELTDHGVLLSTSAAEPGRPTATVPSDCFELKLGARARHVGRGSDHRGAMHSGSADAVSYPETRWRTLLGSSRGTEGALGEPPEW